MKILVTGASGLVGRSLLPELMARGHEIAVLVRNGPRVEPGVVSVFWDSIKGKLDAAAMEKWGNTDVVIHLAGESIASHRWTAGQKERIRSSRVDATELLWRALLKTNQQPSLFISASAIGYYGNRGEETLEESSPPGDEFLSEVCVAWEQAAGAIYYSPDSRQARSNKAARRIYLRFGVILDAQGGALAKMLPAFKLGVGGRLGNGKHWMSWIHIRDAINAILFSLDQNLAGPINVTSSTPLRNADFTIALGRVLRRPVLFPIPKFGLKLLFGEIADALLLTSQRVLPGRLLNAGFKFEYPEIKPALENLLTKKPV